MVVYNRFRKWYGGIFVIIVTKNTFYDAHSKTAIENRLKMLYELNFTKRLLFLSPLSIISASPSLTSYSHKPYPPPWTITTSSPITSPTTSIPPPNRPHRRNHDHHRDFVTLEPPYLLPYTWWLEEADHRGEVVLYTVSCNSDSEAEILLHLRKEEDPHNNNNIGVSTR